MHGPSCSVAHVFRVLVHIHVDVCLEEHCGVHKCRECIHERNSKKSGLKCLPRNFSGLENEIRTFLDNENMRNGFEECPSKTAIDLSIKRRNIVSPLAKEDEEETELPAT